MNYRKNTDNNSVGKPALKVISVIVLADCIALIILLLFGKLLPESLFEYIVKFLLAILVLVPLIGFAGFGLFGWSNRKKRCTLAVEAMVLGINKEGSSVTERSVDTRWVFYEYNYNGQKFREIVNGTSMKMKIGKTVVLYINPDNPTEIYEPNADRANKFIVIIFLFIIIAVMLLQRLPMYFLQGLH